MQRECGNAAVVPYVRPSVCACLTYFEQDMNTIETKPLCASSSNFANMLPVTKYEPYNFRGQRSRSLPNLRVLGNATLCIAHVIIITGTATIIYGDHGPLLFYYIQILYQLDISNTIADDLCGTANK